MLLITSAELVTETTFPAKSFNGEANDLSVGLMLGCWSSRFSEVREVSPVSGLISVILFSLSDRVFREVSPASGLRFEI